MPSHGAGVGTVLQPGAVGAGVGWTTAPAKGYPVAWVRSRVTMLMASTRVLSA